MEFIHTYFIYAYLYIYMFFTDIFSISMYIIYFLNNYMYRKESFNFIEIGINSLY